MADVIVNPQPGFNAGLAGIASRTFKANTAVTQDFDNQCGQGAQIILNVSAKASGPTNLVLKVDGIDPVSGEVYNLLTGAAVTGTGTTVYHIHPGVLNANNVAVNYFLPRRFRITITPTGADTDNYFTASVGVNILR